MWWVTINSSDSSIKREEKEAHEAAAQELIDDDRDPRNPDNHIRVCGWGPTVYNHHIAYHLTAFARELY
jgi:hypothetical protein